MNVRMKSTPTASAIFLVEFTCCVFSIRAVGPLATAEPQAHGPTRFEGPICGQPTLPGNINATSAVFQKFRFGWLRVCLLGDTRRRVLPRGVTPSHPRLVRLSATRGQDDQIGADLPEQRTT